MKSMVTEIGTIKLPRIDGEFAMIPFDIETLAGLPEEFAVIAREMIKGIKSKGQAFFTIHGKTLKKGQTLRRGGPHTDGNYEPHQMTFGGGGGGGWKVGQNGPDINSDLHARQYLSPNGGIIMASNYYACNAWIGEFNEIPHVGGDCSHIDLGDPIKLKENTVYYGNNHFIHESLGVNDDVHRVLARITLPENHEYN